MIEPQNPRKALHLIALLASCVLSLCSASSQQIIMPEDQDIDIMGTVRLIHGLGPPGYGENPKHDAHVSYWALELMEPVNLPCTPTKLEKKKIECHPAKRLKLFFNGLELAKFADLPAAKYRDEFVNVRGKLHRADTMGEMTPIYIDVSEIRAPTPNGEPALCNFAKVYRLKSGLKLTVRREPRLGSAEIQSLPNGTSVYVCDETSAWFQVFYSAVGKPCKSGTPDGLPEPQRRDCRSGWVQKKWIDVISG